MRPMIAEALKYAVLKWAVFPVHTPQPEGDCSCGLVECASVGKHPRIQDWVNQATHQRDIIRRWWREWPQANIGLNVGKSGLVVLDIDLRHGGRMDSLPLAEADRMTPTAQTGGGGFHLLYRAPLGFEISNSNQRLPAGIDVRASGGYIVAPPSKHQSGRCYTWQPGRSPWQVKMLPLPASLMPLLKIKDEPLSEVAPRSAPLRWSPEQGDRPAYVQKALESELDALARAPEGERNATLNKAAFSLGQFIAAGLLPRQEVEALLQITARSVGLGELEIQRTIKSGLEAGLQNPRPYWPDLR